MLPAEGGPTNFEAEILLAPKAPKQNFGYQPQTLEGEGGGGDWGLRGGGVPLLLLRRTAVIIQPCPPSHPEGTYTGGHTR